MCQDTYVLHIFIDTQLIRIRRFSPHRALYLGLRPVSIRTATPPIAGTSTQLGPERTACVAIGSPDCMSAATASCNSPPRHAQSQCTSRPRGCASPTAGQSYRQTAVTTPRRSPHVPVLPPDRRYDASPVAARLRLRQCRLVARPPFFLSLYLVCRCMPLVTPHASRPSSDTANRISPAARRGWTGGAFDEPLLLHASPPPQFRPR